MDTRFSEYFRQRQCAPQWQSFLTALSQEFAAQLPEPDLRTLMQRIGVMFAHQHPLPACETLDALEQALNACWSSQDWGWVELQEQADHLLVSHRNSPLHAAFGEAAAPWSPAFLEGAYRTWLQQLGMGEKLSLRQLSDMDGLGNVDFRLGV